SAISQCIKVLEREHGDVLFDRQMRPLRPNAAGRVLLDRARPLLAHARDVALSVRAATKTSLSLLRIGCVDSFAATIGPALVEQLVGTAENLRMWSGLTPMVSEQLVNRELDLAICTESTVDPERVTQQLLFSERFIAVVPLSHAGAPFVEVARSIPLIRYSRRQMTAQQAERFIRHIGIDAPPMYEFDATDSVCAPIQWGLNVRTVKSRAAVCQSVIATKEVL
ncbi:LysR family transcriptional regulator, partial [Pandoraea communis]|uniref:LysR family transcriptional regulator n=1 Tax=Pandoraea communis TaxID=2508297 RepID=UPI0025A674CB